MYNSFMFVIFMYKLILMILTVSASIWKYQPVEVFCGKETPFCVHVRFPSVVSRPTQPPTYFTFASMDLAEIVRPLSLYLRWFDTKTPNYICLKDFLFHLSGNVSINDLRVYYRRFMTYDDLWNSSIRGF